MAQQQVVHKGHQRRALAARRHVPAAEIGHHRHAGALGDHGGAAQLQGGGLARSAPRGDVPHGLAVAADEIHLPGGQARRPDGLQRRLGKGLPQGEIQPAQPVHRAGLRAEGRKDLLPQARVHRQGDKAEQLPVQPGRRALQPHAGGVDAVGAGAAHQADADHLQVSSLSMAETSSSTMALRRRPVVRFSRPLYTSLVIRAKHSSRSGSHHRQVPVKPV